MYSVMELFSSLFIPPTKVVDDNNVLQGYYLYLSWFKPVDGCYQRVFIVRCIAYTVQAILHRLGPELQRKMGQIGSILTGYSESSHIQSLWTLRGRSDQTKPIRLVLYSTRESFNIVPTCGFFRNCTNRSIYHY